MTSLYPDNRPTAAAEAGRKDFMKPRFTCSGEAKAYKAAAGDMFACQQCQRWYSDTTPWTSDVCPACTAANVDELDLPDIPAVDAFELAMLNYRIEMEKTTLLFKQLGGVL